MRLESHHHQHLHRKETNLSQTLHVNADPSLVQDAVATQYQAAMSVEQARREVPGTRDRAESIVAQAAHEVAQIRTHTSQTMQQAAEEVERVRHQAFLRAQEADNASLVHQRVLDQARLVFQRLQDQMEQQRRVIETLQHEAQFFRNATGHASQTRHLSPRDEHQPIPHSQRPLSPGVQTQTISPIPGLPDLPQQQPTHPHHEDGSIRSPSEHLPIMRLVG